MYFSSDTHALIKQNWAWLELGVRVFCLRVSVLSVYAAQQANDLSEQTFYLQGLCTAPASLLAERG